MVVAQSFKFSDNLFVLPDKTCSTGQGLWLFYFLKFSMCVMVLQRNCNAANKSNYKVLHINLQSPLNRREATSRTNNNEMKGNSILM